ncbi:outer membrane protein OmpA-like peptidoglycan-associated protein [Bacillus mesophilus]|uniref:OmpA family protein n=1 Tax=Bacillus mesophilus TaxID=1808955 RepID=A0A6M0Q6K7_9BACI|nr:OmpA family protein [Bacillus mesophilus]MBM7660381.1 outer membrane protein OmpA-like peptidoglycan-associated protein [Bacillus mesophilus]NEY71090.1 OmpA family protein [Bacillus mesophilus]
MNQKYRRLLDSKIDDNDFWPSFTDLLSTILLVVLLFLLVIINNEQDKVEAKEAELKETEVKIKQQEEIINYLAGIRFDIIEDLENEFSKTNLKIEIDKETGSIKFQNDLLFETGKDVIRPEFKEQLREFIPVYFNILYGKYDQHISEIVVEGHTDDVGTFVNNLDLSQKRAFSVVRYVLSDDFGNFPYKENVQMQITANGRSESDLKYKDDGKTIDQEKSRRVEFKFRLKNYSKWDELVKDIEEVNAK